MTIVGEDFRRYPNVPEVLMAANAMKAGMAIVLLAETGAPRIGSM